MATRSALPEAMMFSAVLRLQIRPTTATGMREPTARLIAAARSAFQPSGTLAGGMMYSTASPMPMETFSMSTPLSAMTLAMRTACSMSMPPGMNSSML